MSYLIRVDDSVSELRGIPRDELDGMIVAATGILQSERDDRFEVVSGQNSILLDEELIASGTVLRSSDDPEYREAVYDYTVPSGGSNLEELQEQLNVDPSKSYTMRFEFPDYYMMVQFNNKKFIDGFKRVARLLGVDPYDYMRQAYQGDKLVEL